MNRLSLTTGRQKSNPPETEKNPVHPLILRILIQTKNSEHDYGITGFTGLDCLLKNSATQNPTPLIVLPADTAQHGEKRF